MPNPHQSIASLLTVAMLFCAPIFISGAHTRASAQESPAVASPERGIQLYRQGDTKGAIEALRAAVKKNKGDADVWYYLGLALKPTPDQKGAREAFENAIKLRPDFAAAHTGLAHVFLLRFDQEREAEREALRALTLNPQDFEAQYIIGMLRLRQDAPQQALESADAALKIKADFPPALLLKSKALLNIYAKGTAPQESFVTRHWILKQMAESIDQYLKLQTDAFEVNVWRDRLQALRDYLAVINIDEVGANRGDERRVFQKEEVTTMPRVLIRPYAQYTSAAHKARAGGTVILRAVFTANGDVNDIVVVQPLKYGLTEAAIKALQQTIFLPATKDGRPVSVYMQIESNFDL